MYISQVVFLKNYKNSIIKKKIQKPYQGAEKDMKYEIQFRTIIVGSFVTVLSGLLKLYELEI